MGRHTSKTYIPAFVGSTNDILIVVMTDTPIDGIVVQQENTFYSVSSFDGVRELTIRLFIGPDGSTLQEVPVTAINATYDKGLVRHVLLTQYGPLTAQIDDAGVNMFWCGEEVYTLREEYQIVMTEDGQPRVLVPTS